MLKIFTNNKYILDALAKELGISYSEQINQTDSVTITDHKSAITVRFNDYEEQLSKPYKIAEIINIISNINNNTKYQLTADAAFFPTEFKIQSAKQEIALTEKESAILLYLLKTSTPIASEELLVEALKYSPEADSNTIETHIYRLRQKLKDLNLEQLIASSPEGYFISAN